MDRHPSQESDTSLPESLFSNLSVAETSITEPDRTSTYAIAEDIEAKGGDPEDAPAFLFEQAPEDAPAFLFEQADYARELKHLYSTATAPGC